MLKHRLAIVGLGNCASSLVQGLALLRDRTLSAYDLGLDRALPPDALDSIEVAAAIDIDARKVGAPIKSAIFALPNCVPTYEANLEPFGVKVLRGPTLDGIAPVMREHAPEISFVESQSPVDDLAGELSACGVDTMLCLLPTGAMQACRFYAELALKIRANMVNGTATPLARAENARQFFDQGLLLIGDDFKSQFGATFLHETLLSALRDRGCIVRVSRQTNAGGNTDFLNMMDPARRDQKERSKRAALAELLTGNVEEASESIADYVPGQGDTKIAHLEVHATGFAGRPIRLTAELTVEDSPNAAGAMVTILGAIASLPITTSNTAATLSDAISALTMKSPRQPKSRDDASRDLRVLLV